jgi:hypothetical protein
VQGNLGNTSSFAAFAVLLATRTRGGGVDEVPDQLAVVLVASPAQQVERGAPSVRGAGPVPDRDGVRVRL